MRGMVVPCSSRSTRHEGLCDEPEGPFMVYAMPRSSLFMWNNHTAQFAPNLA